MIKCMTNFLQVQLYQHDDMLCDYPSMLRTAVIMSMCRCVLDNYVYNITTTNRLGLSEVGRSVDYSTGSKLQGKK